jgi:hypothetical protein
MDSETRNFDHEWHVAINGFTNGKIGQPDWPKFMYEAKTASFEVPRLARLFAMERTGSLGGIHQQCSHSPVEAIPDNHLTCCLGVKCRECPHLKALEAAKITPEQIDTAKAWTCAAHILMRGGDVANEGYILTTSDRMFWDRLHSNLAQPYDGDEE